MTLTDLERQAIVAEARTWLATPYHHHGRIRGAGVDCAMLLAEVYEARGLIAHVDAGFYPVDWHLHQREELFLEWLARLGAREIATPGVADIAVWQFGRTYSHGGIVTALDARRISAVHAYIGLGAVETRTDEAPLAGRPVKFWTLDDGAAA